MNEQTVIAWIVFSCVALGIVWVVRSRRNASAHATRYPTQSLRFCPRCHFRGAPLWKVRGTFALELLLYLFFVLPGIAYTIWRLSNKYTVCPECGEANMVPVTSPIAKRVSRAEPAGV